MTGYASIPTATKAVSTRNVVDYLEKHQADPIDVVQKIESYLAYYEFGDFALDNRSRQALYKGQPIEIGEAQMPLYELFLKRPDDFFTYQDLAREIEGQILELSDATNLMRNRIFRLRKKLEQIAGKEVIRSQAGIGFGWSYKARK
jgi:DNA-binding response OmpR family regulator